MAEISQFAQPDVSPAYFVDFLDFLDKQEPIRNLRAEAAKRMQIVAGQIQFRIGDACAIPYPDSYFDAARSERVFLYLPDRVGAIQEMERVVKPGGRLCLIDTDFDSIAIYSTNPAQTRKMTSIVAASIPNPNSARELPALAMHTGLTDLRVESFAIRTPHDFLERSMSGAWWKAAESGIATTREEASGWLGEQAAHQASGNFFQAWLFVMLTGTV
jgi:SAM-dependent methyltransferase